VNCWRELTATVAEEGLTVTFETVWLTVTATLLVAVAPPAFVMRTEML
jgi:hypothetical protein